MKNQMDKMMHYEYRTRTIVILTEGKDLPCLPAGRLNMQMCLLQHMLNTIQYAYGDPSSLRDVRMTIVFGYFSNKSGYETSLHTVGMVRQVMTKILVHKLSIHDQWLSVIILK